MGILSTDALRRPEVSDPLGMELQVVVSLPKWVLGIKLRPFARTVYILLTIEPSSQSSTLVFETGFLISLELDTYASWASRRAPGIFWFPPTQPWDYKHMPHTQLSNTRDKLRYLCL